MPSMKVALVTGANRGLGFETSRQLAEQGITVLMAARDRGRGEEAAAKLRSEGLDTEFIHLDVTNSDHIAAGRQYIESSFGRLDILVNNAGISHPEDSVPGNSVETISPEALRETFDVNFFGLVALTQSLLPLIKESGSGRIVNVASILGSLTMHSDPESEFYDYKPFAYDASKAAVNQFTVHLAAALKDTPVKVNSAHPGWVKTDMGGDQAPMEIPEGAKTAVRLATLGENGPTGRFFHFDKELPW